MTLILKGPRQMLYDWSTYRKNQKSIAALDRHLRTKNPTLLVHQMGRAGSMTTVSSLRAAGLAMPVYHSHWFNPKNIAKRLNRFDNAPDRELPFNVRVGMRIAEELQERGPGYLPWHVVSVFREPVSRNLSLFFLSIEDFIPGRCSRSLHARLSPRSATELVRRRGPGNFRHRRLRPYLSADRGFQIIRQNDVSMLLIKVEDLDDCYGRAFDEYLGVQIPGLEHLPDAYLARMYESRFARHFYAPEEIGAFRRRWSKAAAVPAA